MCTDASGDPLLTDQRGFPRVVDGNEDGTAACDIGAFESDALTVAVDVKPGEAKNTMNVKSKGVLPVAILSSGTFDASSVDPLSVQFGLNRAVEAHRKGHIEDVNADGKKDLVLHFRTEQTGIRCGDSTASLTGTTFDGNLIQGSDSIETVGCK